MRARVYARAEGLVQGVGFRWFVQERARLNRLVGYVRNCPDGSVEFEAEGERETVEQLLREVRTGPRSARVTDLAVEWITPQSRESAFQIR